MTTEALENGKPSDLLSVHVEDFLDQLRAAGYADRTLRKKRTIVRAFARWMKDQRITLDCLVDSDVGAFLQRRRKQADRFKAERVALRLLLRAKALIKQAPVRVDASANELLERNRCLAGVLISGEDRAGRSAAGCPRSAVSTDAA